MYELQVILGRVIPPQIYRSEQARLFWSVLDLQECPEALSQCKIFMISCLLIFENVNVEHNFVYHMYFNIFLKKKKLIRQIIIFK